MAANLRCCTLFIVIFSKPNVIFWLCLRYVFFILNGVIKPCKINSWGSLLSQSHSYLWFLKVGSSVHEMLFVHYRGVFPLLIEAEFDHLVIVSCQIKFAAAKNLNKQEKLHSCPNYYRTTLCAVYCISELYLDVIQIYCRCSFKHSYSFLLEVWMQRASGSCCSRQSS